MIYLAHTNSKYKILKKQFVLQSSCHTIWKDPKTTAIIVLHVQYVHQQTVLSNSPAKFC
jgi:hypothetical protein